MQETDGCIQGFGACAGASACACACVSDHQLVLHRESSLSRLPGVGRTANSRSRPRNAPRYVPLLTYTTVNSQQHFRVAPQTAVAYPEPECFQLKWNYVSIETAIIGLMFLISLIKTLCMKQTCLWSSWRPAVEHTCIATWMHQLEYFFVRQVC